MNDQGRFRVEAIIRRLSLDAEIISTPDGVPTVERAAAALGVTTDRIIKTLVFVTPSIELVVGIGAGTSRIDRRRLAAEAGTGSLSFAPPELVLDRTGYPAGGVAPIGLPTGVPVIVDRAVMRHETVFGGAGDDLHMLRIRTQDIVVLSEARIADISLPERT